MAITTYQANLMLKNSFGSASYSPETTLYLGLSTTTPTKGGGYTEPSGGSYARVSIDNVGNTTGDFWGDVSSPSGVASQLSNANDSATFPTSTASWGTVTHICIFDAVSGGNLLYWDALVTSRNILTDTQVIFPVDSITIKMVNA